MKTGMIVEKRLVGKKKTMGMNRCWGCMYKVHLMLTVVSETHFLLEAFSGRKPVFCRVPGTKKVKGADF